MRLRTTTKIAIASLACRGLLFARRLGGRSSEVDVTRDGMRWHLDLTEGIDLAIYLFGRFESGTVKLFRRLVRPGDVVLDIGANIGANALELARCVGPDGRVVAFEPTSFAVERLRRNLDANPELARRVTVEQAILGDAPEGAPTEFYASWPLLDEPGRERHARHGGELKKASRAAFRTLDGYVQDENLSSVRLIKLDVDGSEWEVLKGARKTLERWHPFIVMEIAPYVLDDRAGALEGVVDALRDAGYGLTDVATGKTLPVTADGLRADIPDGAGVNVLAEVSRRALEHDQHPEREPPPDGRQ